MYTAHRNERMALLQQIPLNFLVYVKCRVFTFEKGGRVLYLSGPCISRERKQYTKRKDSQRRMLKTEVQGAMGHTGGVHGPCHGGSEESKSGKSETFSPQPYYY